MQLQNILYYNYLYLSGIISVRHFARMHQYWLMGCFCIFFFLLAFSIFILFYFWTIHWRCATDDITTVRHSISINFPYNPFCYKSILRGFHFYLPINTRSSYFWNKLISLLVYSPKMLMPCRESSYIATRAH